MNRPLDANYRNVSFASRDDMAGRLAERVIALIGDRLSPRLLDLGCGSAGVAIGAAKRHPRLTAIGLDVSSLNVESARHAAQAVGLGKRVTIVCADYLEWFGPPFDVIASDSVLHLMDASDADLAERLASDLKPGGFMVATMPVESRANDVRIALRRLWRTLPPSMDKVVLPIAQHLYPGLSADMLADRIPYLRILPHRLFGPSLNSEFARQGLELISSELWSNSSAAKLTHHLIVWRRG